jgi:hypothetical protein
LADRDIAADDLLDFARWTRTIVNQDLGTGGQLSYRRLDLNNSE